MAIKKFPNIRSFAWNSTKAQKWDTTVQKSASGKVRTLTNQLYPEWTITASLPMISDAEANTLHGFVALLKGSYEPFLWLDPEDNKAVGQRLVPTNGYYQCVMAMGSYAEPAEYVEDLRVFINGEEADVGTYTVERGAITFDVAPSADDVVTADYTYYWKVMLADDGLTVTKIFKDINKASIKMVVAR